MDVDDLSFPVNRYSCIFAGSSRFNKGACLLSGAEALQYLNGLLEKSVCLENVCHVLEHVVMEKVELEEFHKIQCLILETNYEPFPGNLVVFLRTLFDSKNYLTIYLMTKLWNLWVERGLVSNQQAIRVLTMLLEKMDGLTPSFRLRLEYVLDCCQSLCGGMKKKSTMYEWKLELDEFQMGHGSHRNDALLPKLLTYLKKLIRDQSQLPSRLLRERLDVCMRWIIRLSEKSDEVVHGHVLSTLVSMKPVYHLLPQDTIYRYLSSCARLKCIDYVKDWILVFEGFLNQSHNDWLEEFVVLESLEQYARHTMYPDVLMGFLEKHEKLKKGLLHRLTKSSNKEKENNVMFIEWNQYGQMIASTHRNPFMNREESILARLRTLIDKSKEQDEMDTLKRLHYKLECLVRELRQVIDSHGNTT
jgi:hypothetical protein